VRRSGNQAKSGLPRLPPPGEDDCGRRELHRQAEAQCRRVAARCLLQLTEQAGAERKAELVGATPSEVAGTLRVQRAKRLIDQTAMPLSEIAFAAGFQSVRRFNDAFRATYGRPPSAFRRAAG